MKRRPLILYLWLGSSSVGTVLAILALREVVRNWFAVRLVSDPGEQDVLLDILAGNLYQQTTRLVMEGLCWTAGIVSYVSPQQEATRPTSARVIGWLVVAFRLMLTLNNGVEYFSNRSRREKLTRIHRESPG